jgi:RNA polymerase sigma-70 factor
VLALLTFRGYRPTVLQTESLKNLALCANQLHEHHTLCSSNYGNFDVPFDDFRDAIANAALKYLVRFGQPTVGPSADELTNFIGELQLLDLYLALGCLRGDENAWWTFDRQHRSFIERWTRRLVHADTDADEVIDAVYVELFGTKMVGTVRQSKFRTYTGRGTLRGWLRTIILHAVVDLYRTRKLEVSLNDSAGNEDEPRAWNIPISGAEDLMLSTVVRERYRSATTAALDKALATLDDHETLLLLYYHVEGLKLREIARIVEEPRSPIRRWFQRRRSPHGRVHESTVMRWLEKVYRKIAERFQAELAGPHGLKPEEIEICKAIAAEDAGTEIKIAAANSTSNSQGNINTESSPS